MKHFSTVNKDTMPISGVWLRTIGGRIHLLVEYEGRWRLVNDEPLCDRVSHITECEGINLSPIDGKCVEFLGGVVAPGIPA